MNIIVGKVEIQHLKSKSDFVDVDFFFYYTMSIYLEVRKGCIMHYLQSVEYYNCYSSFQY